MTKNRFILLLKSDLARVIGKNKGLCSLSALKCYYVSESFKVCFWFRLGSYIATKNNFIFKTLIGANAVVTRDVPANTVVAGVPAKIISTDSSKCFNKEWGKYFHHSYSTL